jgi:hypothetical protein
VTEESLHDIVRTRPRRAALEALRHFFPSTFPGEGLSAVLRRCRSETYTGPLHRSHAVRSSALNGHTHETLG